MSSTDKPSGFINLAGSLCIIFCLLVWAIYQFHYSINADNAVLVEFARRMLDGGKLGIDFIDTNPPYSILIYLPAALLGKFMPLWHAVTLYTFILALLSLFLCHGILKRFAFLSTNEKTAFIVAYAAASIAMANIFFGERDHLVIFGLLPLLLTQFAITNSIQLPRGLKFAALIFGALVILIKPHYGLMPFLMIAHRVIKRRNLWPLKDSDFLILAGTTLAYIALNATLFSFYWTDIFSDVAKTYITSTASVLLTPHFKIVAFLTLIAIGGFFTARKTTKGSFYLMFSLAVACLLIAYGAQYKGYYYHLLPALILGYTIGASCIAATQKNIFLVLLPAFALLFAAFPIRTTYPSHDGYAKLPMAEMLLGCPQPCNFFVFNDYAYIGHETALYKNAFHASRFSSLWFQPTMFCKGAPDDKYADMIAEDLKRWQPDRLLLIKSTDVCPDGTEKPFNFVSFFSQNKNVADEMKNYKFIHDIRFNRDVYFRGTDADYDYPMTFELYRRDNAQ